MLARKPLRGTVAENVLRYGTGAIHVDACRVATEETITNHARVAPRQTVFAKRNWSPPQETHQTAGQALGRWPANLLHDGSEEVVGLFPADQTSGGRRGGEPAIVEDRTGMGAGFSSGSSGAAGWNHGTTHGDSGSAARFFPALPRLPIDDEAERLFYTAKASTAERGEDNTHATVKPVELMRWLVRLVTPPDGTVLDCFLGSGTTGVAARLEGFRFIGIEREPEYMAIAEQRMGADYGAVPRVVSKPKENAVQPSLFAAVQAPGRAK